MRDCHQYDGLSRAAFISALRSLFLVASLALVFLISVFLYSAPAHAASSVVVWGGITYDDETGDIISNDRIEMEDGGTYQVPLGVSKEVYADILIGHYYGVYGHLYKINSETNDRTDLGLLNTLTSNEIAWNEYGVYEVDIYDAGAPVLSRRSLFGRLADFLFGNVAHAAAGDFIETIRFTLVPLQGPNTAPALSFLPGSEGISSLKGSPNTTNFTFSVVYTDLENTAPSFIAVALNDGAPHALSIDPHATDLLADGLFSNGEAYSTSFKIPERGEHSISFTASDAVATTTLQSPRTITIGSSNVAFFPGVQSTYLYKDGFLSQDQVWLPNITVGTDNDVHNLSMNNGGESVEDVYTKEGEIIVKAYAKKPIYEGFTQTMDSLVSEGVINAWKPVSYDWRLDLDTLLASGKQDEEKISYLAATDTPYIYQEVKKLADSSKSGRVTIIGHSNGGLLAKAFLADLEARHDPLLEKIDMVVLVASPQLGTPKTLLPMLHGAENPLSDWQIGLEDRTWREATRYSPAAYNLLPSDKYFTHTTTASQGPVVVFDQSLDQLAETIQKRDVSGYLGGDLASVFDYRSRYGDSIDSFTELQEFLRGAEGRREPRYEDVIHPTLLSESLLADTNATHNSIDTWTPPDVDYDGISDIRVVQIAGFGVPTIKGVRYETKKYIQGCAPLGGPAACEQLYGVEVNPITTTLGDETVMLGSATAMPVETYYVDLKNYNKDKGLTGDLVKRDHANLMAAQPITQTLSRLMRGEVTDSIQYVSTQIPSTIEDMTVLEMHSPVELEVLGQGGDRLGWTLDIDTGAKYLEESITNTSYWKLGDATFIALPSDSAYAVKLDGLATGTFTFKVKKLENDDVVETTSYSDLPVTAALKGEIIVPASSTPTNLTLDTDGDGVTDKTIQSDQTKVEKTLRELILDFKNLSSTLILNKELKGSLKQCIKDLDTLSEPKKRDKKHRREHEKDRYHDDNRKEDICKEFIKGLRHKKSGINKEIADSLVAILTKIKEALK